MYLLGIQRFHNIEWHFKVLHAKIIVIDTGGKFAAGVVDTVANFHRYQQHVRNWWQNLPPVSLIPVAILPPVSWIRVVHLDLRIFEKIRNGPNGTLWGWEETDS
jgi:hypothetical protein